jgi:hypothetical protein
MADRTAQDTQVNEQIELLLQLQLKHMTPQDLLTWQQRIDDIKDNYRKSRAIEDDVNAKKEKREEAGKAAESIAKALPDICKGIISAQKAFANGDYMTGSAAIMDICAAVAPVIGSSISSFLGVAGPVGMLFGAVFSVVAQILALLGPKAESEISQIKKLLLELENEKELITIKAVHDAVRLHAKMLTDQANVLSKVLASPLSTYDQYVAFGLAIKEARIVVDEDGNVEKSVASFQGWHVLEYLRSETFQDVPNWPKVLEIYCQTYGDLITAALSIRLFCDSADMRKRFEDIRPNPKDSQQIITQKNTALEKLTDLVSYANVRQKEYVTCNAIVLEALGELKTAARARGLFTYLGMDHNVCAATGKQVQPGTWTPTRIGYGGRGHRFSVSPSGDADPLTPKYRIWECEYWQQGGAGDVVHVRIDPSSLEISDGGVTVSPDKWADVWAVPNRNKQDRAFVYCAHDGGTSGYLALFEETEKNVWKKLDWQPVTKSGLVNVRVITLPPKTLFDDPDKDAIPQGSPLLNGDGHNGSIHYGALRSSSEIFVVAGDITTYVRSPWQDYSGIEVDDNYLWVFRPDAIACATHASVIKCASGKSTSPRWITHVPTQILGDLTGGEGNVWWHGIDSTEESYHHPWRPPVMGLLSLFPCSDGTLSACAYTRTIAPDPRHGYMVQDQRLTYTAVYSVDVKAGTIGVKPWTKIGGQAYQIQKMAVPCWPLLESLEVNLKPKS